MRRLPALAAALATLTCLSTPALANNSKLTSLELLGVLLHEMVHHWVEVTHGHGVSAANGGKRVIGHGKEWKREMRRVGYTGKITRFTGKERFLPF